MKKQRSVKHDTVYHVVWYSMVYLVMYDESRIGYDYWIRITNNEFGATGAFSQNSSFTYYLQQPNAGIIIKEANELESLWMRRCIKAGKFVPCPTDVIINQYEIY